MRATSGPLPRPAGTSGQGEIVECQIPPLPQDRAWLRLRSRPPTEIWGSRGLHLGKLIRLRHLLQPPSPQRRFPGASLCQGRVRIKAKSGPFQLRLNPSKKRQGPCPRHTPDATSLLRSMKGCGAAAEGAAAFPWGGIRLSTPAPPPTPFVEAGGVRPRCLATSVRVLNFGAPCETSHLKMAPLEMTVVPEI